MYTPISTHFASYRANSMSVLDAQANRNSFTRFGDLCLAVYSHLYSALPIVPNTIRTRLVAYVDGFNRTGLFDLQQRKNGIFAHEFVFSSAVKFDRIIDRDLATDVNSRTLNVKTWKYKGTQFVSVGFTAQQAKAFDIGFNVGPVYLNSAFCFVNLIQNSKLLGSNFKPKMFSGPVLDQLWYADAAQVFRLPYRVWHLNGEIWANYSHLLHSNFNEDLARLVIERAEINRVTTVIEDLAKYVSLNPDLSSSFGQQTSTSRVLDILTRNAK